MEGFGNDVSVIFSSFFFSSPPPFFLLVIVVVFVVERYACGMRLSSTSLETATGSAVQLCGNTLD